MAKFIATYEDIGSNAAGAMSIRATTRSGAFRDADKGRNTHGRNKKKHRIAAIWTDNGEKVWDGNWTSAADKYLSRS